MSLQFVWPALMAAGLSLAACADLEQAVRQQPQSESLAAFTGGNANALVGKDRNSLVRQFGNPDRIFDLDGKRAAYVYGKGRRPGCMDAYVVNSVGRIISYHCR